MNNVVNREINPYFWNPEEVLGYGANIHIIVGMRGPGKSFGCKRFSITRIQNEYGFNDLGKIINECNESKMKKKFMLIRRYRSEASEHAESYFSDLLQEGVIPDGTYKIKNGRYVGKIFYNDKHIGYFIGLSIANKIKSNSFPDVDFMFFDEFMLDPNDRFSQYLNKEPRKLMSLYSTVARKRKNVKLFLVANNLTSFCPYIVDWKLEYPTNKKGIRLFHDGFILVQMVVKEAFSNDAESSRYGKFLRAIDPDLADYENKNKALFDTENLVKKRPDKTRYFFTVVYNGKNYGVWIDEKNYYYVSEKFDPNHKIKFVARIDDMDNTTMTMKNAYMSETFTMFINAFEIGRVYFEDIKLKNILIGIMRTRGRM